jgi:RHS repeat-associated protein
MQTAACPTPETSVPATVTYSATNQVTFVSGSLPLGLSYDGAGNVTSDGLNYYAYDGEGRLCAVENTLVDSYTQYVYDAGGTRVAKGASASLTCGAPGSNFSLTNQYLVGLGGEQVTELDGSDDWLHTNVWAGGRLLATYDGFGIHFPLTDPLGTKRIQANAYGAVDETCFSLPYGDGLNCIGDDATEHHFTGKERDTESGNDYFGARYYASNMGRFMSPDWSPTPAAIPFADLSNPQTLNLYSYVNNNPLTKLDPNGHDWFHVDNKWQWQKGHTYHDADGNATKDKGYAGLLVATKTGVNAQGATTFHLTLYDQNKIVGQGDGFSGNNHYADTGTIPDGNYHTLGRLDPPPTGQNPSSSQGDPPQIYGYQKIFPSADPYLSQVLGAYGPIRARLNPLEPGQPDGGYYLHGQGPNGFHEEGWTHGCLSTGRDASMIFYMQSHIGSAGVSVDTQVVKP